MFKTIFIMAFLVSNAMAEMSFKETIMNFIKANVSQKITATDFDIRLDNWTDSWDKDVVPESSLTVKDMQITQEQRRFAIQVYGFKEGPKRFMGSIEWLADAAMLNRPIAPGEVIEESDIVMQKTNADRINANQIKDKKDLLGKTAKNTMLKAGVLLNKSDIQSPIVIKKGALTVIRYEKGNLKITAQAIALQDGFQGETIPFETHTTTKDANNNTHKKTIHAEVTGINTAMIGAHHAV